MAKAEMAKKDKAALRKEAEQLREKIRHHEYLYYVQDDAGDLRRAIRPPDGAAEGD